MRNSIKFNIYSIEFKYGTLSKINSVLSALFLVRLYHQANYPKLRMRSILKIQFDAIIFKNVSDHHQLSI